MEFKKDTLEPLYKLSIGKSGASNALYISRKMGIQDKIIEKTKSYLEKKDYNYNLIKDSKVKKEKEIVDNEKQYDYSVGDRVVILETKEKAIVYKEKDNFNNLIILHKGEFIEINLKRVKLDLKATELYPKDYDLNQLFVSYKERKLDHDIERGSKKALKKLKKERKATISE